MPDYRQIAFAVTVAVTILYLLSSNLPIFQGEVLEATLGENRPSFYQIHARHNEHGVSDFRITCYNASASQKSNEDNRPLLTWSNPVFLRAGSVKLRRPAINNGYFEGISEAKYFATTRMKIDKIGVRPSLLEEMKKKDCFDIDGNLILSSEHVPFHFEICIDLTLNNNNNLQSCPILETKIKVESPVINRLYFMYGSQSDETFHGFGTQYSAWNLKGRRLPLFVVEQGVGRGLQPLSWMLDNLRGFSMSLDDNGWIVRYLLVGSLLMLLLLKFSSNYEELTSQQQIVVMVVSAAVLSYYMYPKYTSRMAGDWFTTYSPSPLYITNMNRGLILHNTQPAIFDFTDGKSVTLEVWSKEATMKFFDGSNPLDLIQQMTTFTGRMRPLPDWILQGAVVSAQGGSAEVRRVSKILIENDIPVVSLWIQDWVGTVPTDTQSGKQLRWRWEVNDDMYGDWSKLVTGLAEKKIRVMTYVNPRWADISDDRGRTSRFVGYVVGKRYRQYFKEGVTNGYFVKKQDGSVYVLTSGLVEYALLDLTNPDAWDWMKAIIKENMIGQTSASGWMGDLGEGLPLDAKLYSNMSGEAYHNYYPVAWAQLQREAVLEAGREDDVVAFSRSGYLESPRYARLFWLGDQMTSWDSYDGLKSVLFGHFSGGVSGMALQHSDVGGYTVIPDGLYKFTRNAELQMRWTELSTFADAILRTHVSLEPDKVVQIWSDQATLAHFKKFATIFASLASYRKELMHEAFKKGYPLVRHLFLHYPQDKRVMKTLLKRKVQDSIVNQEFMLGYDILMAPIVDPGKTKRTVYLPAGEWLDIWRGKVYSVSEKGMYLKSFPAPIGQPPVFYRESSKVAKDWKFYNGYGVFDE